MAVPSASAHCGQVKMSRSCSAKVKAKARAAQGAGKTGPSSSRGMEATAVKAVAEPSELASLRAAWRQAAQETPHGEPVELESRVHGGTTQP